MADSDSPTTLMDTIANHELVKRASGWERAIIIVGMLLFTPTGFNFVTDAIAEVKESVVQQAQIVDELASIKAKEGANALELDGLNETVRGVSAEQTIINLEVKDIKEDFHKFEKRFDKYEAKQEAFQMEMRQWMMRQ